MTPVTIRGQSYRSARAAAKALGLDDTTIQYHLNQGTLDRAGTWLHKKRPCVIEGTSYPTMTAAARALGVSTEAIRQRLNRAAKKAQKEQSA